MNAAKGNVCDGTSDAGLKTHAAAELLTVDVVPVAPHPTDVEEQVVLQLALLGHDTRQSLTVRKSEQD